MPPTCKVRLLVRAQPPPQQQPEDNLRKEIESFRREKEALLDKALLSPAPGGDYTESFTLYSFSRDLRVDVDAMNERLRAKDLRRHRIAQKPDEAFGIVVDFDEVIVNTRALLRASWTQLAQEGGFTMPSIERPQLFTVPTDRAILDILQWTRDFREARDLAYRFATIYSLHFTAVTAAPEGTVTWLQALNKAGVSVAVVSSLDRYTVGAALDRMQLRPYFQALSSLEDGFENRSQLLLSACWNLQRPPNMSAYVASSPTSITAAHNTTLKAICVQGWHKGFELRSADLKVTRLDELSVFNIRRLFSNRGNELMDLKLHFTGIPPGRRKARVDMLDPDEDPDKRKR